MLGEAQVVADSEPHLRPETEEKGGQVSEGMKAVGGRGCKEWDLIIEREKGGWG